MKPLQRILVGICLLVCYCAHGQVITTVAGNGSNTYGGDGGNATAAAIGFPGDIIFDKAGNLYIAEYNNSIRKIATDGTITTISGNGIVGFGGDNGPATAAQFNGLSCLAINTKGQLFISDMYNNRIRCVELTTGQISTVAGNGLVSYIGDGVPATSTSIYSPSGVTCDKDNNVYFTDYGNHRIRRIDSFGIISTIAGNGSAIDSGDGGQATAAGLLAPSGLCIDSYGNLIIADSKKIRKVNLVSGIITTIAGTNIFGFGGDGGLADTAKFSSAISVVCGGDGSLYISDQNNNRIRKVSVSNYISTIVGNGTTTYNGDTLVPTIASVSSPRGIALDSCGNLYISDNGHNRIRKVSFNPNCWPLAVDDAQQNKPLTIYPNPTTCTLHIDNLKAPATYTLYDITGRVVATSRLTTGPNQINTTHLSPGIYLLHLLHNDGTREVHKIVKE